MAHSNNTSAKCKAKPAWPERSNAKLTTKAVPVTAQTQNPRDGRWRFITAASAAVARGSTPVMTLAWEASTYRMAREVKRGKPNTTPTATKPRPFICERVGRKARVNHR